MCSFPRTASPWLDRNWRGVSWLRDAATSYTILAVYNSRQRAVRNALPTPGALPTVSMLCTAQKIGTLCALPHLSLKCALERIIPFQLDYILAAIPQPIPVFEVVPHLGHAP